MVVKNYISKSYQKVDAYSGVNAIEDILLENDFVTVFDDDEFCGILTPSDLIKHPHKLVIDCLTEKEKLNAEDTIIHALARLYENRSSALPVFDNNNYIGIIEKKYIIGALTERISELHNESLISQKIKTEFLNNLSHEIRTPLNGILGFLDVISALDLNNFKDEGERHVDSLEKSAGQFLLLMNDLIELSLVHSGERLKVDTRAIRLAEIFCELEDFFTINSLNVEKNLKINCINPCPSQILFTDREKLKHIFYHLIDNATKFSERNSLITFGFRGIINSSASFFVTNTGSQISDKDKLKIFEIFEKQDKSDSRSLEGLGVGLSVVRNLLDALGGTIEILTKPDETTFNFSILVKELNTVSGCMV